LLPRDGAGLSQAAVGELMLNGKIIGRLSTETRLGRLLCLPQACSQGRFVSKSQTSRSTLRAGGGLGTAQPRGGDMPPPHGALGGHWGPPPAPRTRGNTFPQRRRCRKLLPGGRKAPGHRSPGTWGHPARRDPGGTLGATSEPSWSSREATRARAQQPVK